MTSRERETWKQRMAFRTYQAAAWMGRTLPPRIGRSVFQGGGALAHRKLHGVRATVAGNMAHVLGRDVDDPSVALATREAFRLYARYWHETFLVRRMPDEEVRRRFEMVGREHVDRALEAGRGCVAVLPHMGNWDVAGRWLDIEGYRVVAVAEELKPRRLLELFVRHREELGMRIIPLTKDGHVGQQLASYLAQNWIVALVADRDLSGRGVEVEMFGGTRKLPAGPALLSLSTGAPLMVCPMYTTERGWSCRLHAPLEIERTGNMREDVRALTRLMAKEFERAIAVNPPDWHMFQPAWPTAEAPADTRG